MTNRSIRVTIARTVVDSTSFKPVTDNNRLIQYDDEHVHG